MTREEPAEFTFKQRVEAFWVWFAEEAERFHRTIEDSQCSSLSGEMSAKVDELLPGMAWVFGPGEKDGQHSLTLSGEGVEAKQIMAAQWLLRAPELDGWKFYADRQPAKDPGSFSLKFDDFTVKPIEFWVTPEIDEENECVDITVWHPLVEQASKGTFQMALFLVLDEIFGEIGTGCWIGGMEFGQKKLAASMPIVELKEFLETVRAERGWKLRHPCESWVSYSLPVEKRDHRPRFDTIAGACGAWRTFRDFLDDPRSFEDAFQDYSAEWIYLAFPTSVLPKGEEVDARETMADAIAEELEREQSGIRLGGAIGTTRSYLDFLILDGSRSLELIRGAARKAGFPEDTQVEYLAATKSGLGFPLFPGEN